MGIASLKDLYLDEIADLLHTERQALPALQRMAAVAHAPELRETLQRHADASRLHVERLELVLARLGAPDRPGRSSAADGLLEQAGERLARADTPDVRDAAIIGAAQRLEHYEIAAYGCARAYARRLDRREDAELLETSLAEEGVADHRLSEIAEAHVNDDARTEADLYERARGGRLRYVGADRLDTSRLSSGRLRVQSVGGDDVGRFDGMVVDLDAARPAYVIVDARGPFSGRRRLLPASQVGFDDHDRVLRVDVDRDTLNRYPAFDPDQFESLSDEACRSAVRLVDVLGRDAAGVDRPRPSEPPPEWLMTGVWLTVPPERAEGLTEDARTFANEFDPRGQERS